ncbi:MAG: hypothetical protein LBV54_06250 [Puniceicoccales bacterium]|jgi:hypothetical protein|nr:hypothetical protein [Puniceicoccales bacterium]
MIIFTKKMPLFTFFHHFRIDSFVLLFFYILFPITISFADSLGSVEKESFRAFRERIISNNLLPDNLSLSYECEEIGHGNLSAQEKSKIVWDFKGKNADIFSLSSSKYTKKVTATKKIISDGTSISLVAGWPKSGGKLDSDLFSAMPFANLPYDTKPFCAIDSGPFLGGGGADEYISFFYASVSKVPFVNLLGLSENVTMESENHSIKIIFKISPRERTVYTLDKNGYVVRKEVFKRMSRADGTLGNEERTIMWEVKKAKIINGIWIPIVLEGEIVMNDGVKLESKVQHRMIVSEKSIVINQALKNENFLIKIPVGSVVQDNRKGIIYEADGISDNLEESLATALEALVKKGKIPQEQQK